MSKQTVHCISCHLGGYTACRLYKSLYTDYTANLFRLKTKRADEGNFVRFFYLYNASYDLREEVDTAG
jgi:hypothetical protein